MEKFFERLSRMPLGRLVLSYFLVILIFSFFYFILTVHYPMHGLQSDAKVFGNDLQGF